MGVHKSILSALLTCFSALNVNASSVADDFRKLATANNHLALAVCHQLSNRTSENVFFSPFSLSSTFGMIYYGAKGETSKELRNALGYEAAAISDDEVHESFRNYLTQSMNRDDGNYDLHSVNVMFIDKRMHLVSDYKKNVQDLYQAEVRETHFATDVKKMVEDTNKLVRSKTHDKIDRIFEEVNFDHQTVMVALNAVYFKGVWKSLFNRNRTFKQIFYSSDCEPVGRQIPMMHMASNFLYTEEDDCQALELPYKGGNISMLVLLPSQKDGLPALESLLTFEKLNVIRQRLNTTQVKVTLPKFKVEYSKEVSNAFQALGAKKIFRPDAELSGISRNSGTYVSKIFHKATFEVNEKGSEAAAVTTVLIHRVSAYANTAEWIEFNVNHPFLFVIFDKKNGMILFMGRIKAL